MRSFGIVFGVRLVDFVIVGLGAECSRDREPSAEVIVWRAIEEMGDGYGIATFGT